MSRPNLSGRDPDRSVGSEIATSRARSGNRSLVGKSVGGLAVLVLVGLYALAQPVINERMGWDLPELRHGADGQITVVESKPGSKSAIAPASNPKLEKPDEKSFSPESPITAAEKPASPKVDSSKPTSSKYSETKPGMPTISKGPLADRLRPSGSSNSAKTSSSKPSDSRMSPAKPAVTAAASKDDDLLHGLLKEIGSKRYVSPAGLLYTPGSAEGHRLEHLRRHTEDQPTRPGSHGVFDGGMEGALKTIDLAYERAKKGERTTKQVDDGRTIYTVDMGSRVGFIGGSEGRRRRTPMARRVRLVLEETRVITAYPM